MIGKVVINTTKTFYKRNLSLLYLLTLNRFYSTNKYNNKMEETNEVAAKI